MTKNDNSEKIDKALTKRVEQILPDKIGLKNLMQKRKIRVYLGIDPTGRRLHLGHVIPLKKLQDFADLGHEVILVVGTGTVLAGDPSQRDAARPKILEKEIKENIKNWKKQVGNILNFSKVKIKYNGDWLLKLRLKEVIDIASNISASRLFQRDMFKKRLEAGNVVWMHEVLYPILQGYDSVFMDIDLEIGGSDQVFNMLVGRELQQKMRKKEKFVLTCPMILGTDGKTMSKSSGNCIWIDDSPKEKFGKVMSISDKLIIPYLETLTDLDSEKVKQYKEDLDSNKLNPKDVKKELAFEIVKTYNSLKEAKIAKEEFEKIFEEKKLPSIIKEFTLSGKINILDLLIKTELTSSKSEAKRLVVQKGVRINEVIWDDWKKDVDVKKGMVISVGKRNFAKIKYI